MEVYHVSIEKCENLMNELNRIVDNYGIKPTNSFISAFFIYHMKKSGVEKDDFIRLMSNSWDSLIEMDNLD